MGANAIHRLREEPTFGFLPPNSESLTPIFQVRGGKGPHPLPRCSKDGFRQQASGTFAFRARHVNDGKRFFRISQPGQKTTNWPQVKPRGRIGGTALEVDQSLEPGARLVHVAYPLVQTALGLWPPPVRVLTRKNREGGQNGRLLRVPVLP